MPKYLVDVREVWTQTVEIEAPGPEEAIAAVQEGGGDYLDDSLEYSHTLDSDGWTVEEKKQHAGQESE